MEFRYLAKYIHFLFLMEQKPLGFYKHIQCNRHFRHLQMRQTNDQRRNLRFRWYWLKLFVVLGSKRHPNQLLLQNKDLLLHLYKLPNHCLQLNSYEYQNHFQKHRLLLSWYC